MALESYRRQRVISNSANADFDQIILLNAGDVDGRIVRFEAAKGNGRAATACKLWIDKGEGLAVFCELIRVDMPTPTWEAAIPVKGLDVGMYDAAIRLEDVDGSITETMPLRVQVVGSILAESEATEEMQDALDDFEIRTRAALADIAEAITDAETVTTDARTAAQSATSAATRANAAAVSAETAAGNIAAEVDSNGIVTVTDADGTQTEFSGLAEAVLLARGAAERADDAAVNANAAKTAANSAALAANSAATSATSAAETATGAAETATSAAGSANTAATNATSAASTATAAATSANSAATAATNAATSANNAATAATTATTNANTATTNANSATTAANEAAETATDAATAASEAAEDATDAATEARDAAAAALASVGNIVLGEISMLDGAIETVDDAYVSPIRGIEVEGKSTQASVAGNQLYSRSDPLVYKINNYYYVEYRLLNSPKADQEYTLSYYAESDLEPFDCTIGIGSSFGSGNGYLRDIGTISNQSSGQITLTFTVTQAHIDSIVNRGFSEDSIVLAFRPIRYGSQKTANCSVSNIMLNAGSTALPWEPYVGGIPSPNPDFPQAIHSVAEAGQVIGGKNLLQGYEYAVDGYVIGSGSQNAGQIAPPTDKGEKTWPYIRIPSWGTKITFGAISYADNTDPWCSIAYYDEGLNFISRPGGAATTTYTLTPPSNARYMRFTGRTYGGRAVYSLSFGYDLVTDGFATTTPLIPSGTEPLRSLPNGVRDELRVHEDGSREIVRRVGVVDIESSTGTHVVYGDYKRWQINVPLLASISSSVSDRQNCRSNVFSVKTYENNAVPVTGANTDLINGSICIYRNGDTKLVFVGLPGETAETWSDFAAWYEENDCMIIYPLATPVIEPLQSISMPSAPSSDVTAWLDSNDESSSPIATDSVVSYERSMQIVIDKLEQAIADL